MSDTDYTTLPLVRLGALHHAAAENARKARTAEQRRLGEIRACVRTGQDWLPAATLLVEAIDAAHEAEDVRDGTKAEWERRRGLLAEAIYAKTGYGNTVHVRLEDEYQWEPHCDSHAPHLSFAVPDCEHCCTAFDASLTDRPANLGPSGATGAAGERE